MQYYAFVVQEVFPASTNIRIYKETALAFFATLISVADFLLWQKSIPYIASGALGNGFQFIAPVFLLSLAGACVSLASFFVSRPWMLYGSTAMGIGIPFFFLAPSGAAAAGFLGSVVLALFAAYRMNREFHFSFGFLLSKIVKYGLPLYFTAAALAVSVFYIENVRKDSQDPLSFLLPRPVIGFLLEKTSQSFAPSLGLFAIRANQPADETLAVLVSESLRAEGISEKTVSSEERARLLELERARLKRELGIVVREGDTVLDAFYLTIGERVRDLLGPYAPYLPFASGVAFFFAFKALTLPLYFFSLALAFLLIKLALLTTIVRVEKKKVEVERLTF